MFDPAEQQPGPTVQTGPGVITEQDLKTAYCSSVQALKDYLSISNLNRYDITGVYCTNAGFQGTCPLLTDD